MPSKLWPQSQWVLVFIVPSLCSPMNFYGIVAFRGKLLATFSSRELLTSHSDLTFSYPISYGNFLPCCHHTSWASGHCRLLFNLKSMSFSTAFLLLTLGFCSSSGPCRLSCHFGLANVISLNLYFCMFSPSSMSSQANVLKSFFITNHCVILIPSP